MCDDHTTFPPPPSPDKPASHLNEIDTHLRAESASQTTVDQSASHRLIANLTGSNHQQHHHAPWNPPLVD